VYVTVPLPPEELMSMLVVPSSEPEPELTVRVTASLATMPAVEIFPNESSALTTGCWFNCEPVYDAPPGCVVNTSLEAASALTTMLLEVTLVKLVAVKLMLIVFGNVVRKVSESGDAVHRRCGGRAL